MTRKSKAVPVRAAQAAPSAPAAAAAPPRAAVETSEGGADTTMSVDAAGSGLPQAADGADSVGTPASSEAASSLQMSAASDTLLGSTVDSLVVGAGDDTISGGQGSGFFRDADHDWRDFGDTTLLGSSILPATIDIGRSEPLTLGTLVVMTQGCSGLSEEAWNGLPEDTREAALALMLDGMRAVGLTQTKIEALLAPVDDSLVTITAKTRYGRPMTRCGHLWLRRPRTQAVTPEVAARLRADPNLIVKDD